MTRFASDMPAARALMLSICLLAYSVGVSAHHVLGRPAYSLNEDSNTPPSMQVETQIGAYFVNYMVFPAFPRAGEPGRINLYASTIEGGIPFAGEVSFSVRDDSLFAGRMEPLGTQMPDDNVFRQGFVFDEDGAYIITAGFDVDGEPYSIDFPLRIGQGGSMGPVAIAVLMVVLILASVTLLQRKRLLQIKIRDSHRQQNS